jgi:hypothetical protein
MRATKTAGALPIGAPAVAISIYWAAGPASEPGRPQEAWPWEGSYNAGVQAKPSFADLGVWAAEGVEDKLAKIEEHMGILASQ